MCDQTMWSKFIIGWLSPDDIDQNVLIWKLDIDSLPGPTLQPINAVVNPTRTTPGNGLPTAQAGQRYLLLDNPTEQSAAWGTIIGAAANDIIEYNGNDWIVSFNSTQYQSVKNYVINLYNGKLLEWSDSNWGEYIGKRYGPGEWRLAL